MGASSEYKKLFLRTVKWDCEDGNLILWNQLKALARARIKDTGKGKILIAASANGKSFTFQAPLAGQGVTIADLTLITAELLDRYEDAKAMLVARGVAVPTDQQIYDEMIALFTPMRDEERDYSNLPL